MNKKVIKKMMCFDVVIHKSLGTNSLGTSKSKELNLMGYLCSKAEQVVNDEGDEVISSEQIYLTGEDALKVNNKDTVTTTNYSKRKIIKRHIYYMPNAKPGVGVLYLV